MRAISTPFFTLLFCILLVSCSSNQNKQPVLKTGDGRLEVPGGSVWYKISGVSKGTPVVLVHGGPGMSSYYLKPLEALGDERQVIRYDQLGGGKSDRITDTSMFTIEHFVRELDSLRSALGIPVWHIVGHSWGTIVALEYYRSYPSRVASLSLAGAVFDVAAYEAHTRQLLGTLPEASQSIVRNAEATKNFNDTNYQKVMGEFYAQYVYRHPVKEDLDSLFATMNGDIYNYMQGPSEFTITGTLKRYNSTGYLPHVKVPTLFTTGEFDEVGPEIVKGLAAAVPGAQCVVFPGSAHISMWDVPDENVAVERQFLHSVDSAMAQSK